MGGLSALSGDKKPDQPSLFGAPKTDTKLAEAPKADIKPTGFGAPNTGTSLFGQATAASQSTQSTTAPQT